MTRPLTRRRFLSLSAACLASPLQAQQWNGQGFGADLALTLAAPADLSWLAREIAQIETVFSLYDPSSELSRLNASGALRPSAMLREVLTLADQLHTRTGGLFDPSVGLLWHDASARAQVGWERVSLGATVRLGRGQSLTLNGLVQGYAADRIAQRLGQGKMLINMGEYRAQGAFKLALEDPSAGALGQLTLQDSALATSSPYAIPQGHIWGPRGELPLWSTVAIAAPTAAEADGLSTAACLMTEPQIRALGRPAWLVDFAGNLITL